MLFLLTITPRIANNIINKKLVPNWLLLAKQFLSKPIPRMASNFARNVVKISENYGQTNTKETQTIGRTKLTMIRRSLTNKYTETFTLAEKVQLNDSVFWLVKANLSGII